MDISKATAYAMINVMNEQKTNAKATATKVGLNEGAIRLVTTGKTKHPTLKTLHSFCTATGYTLSEFFSRKEFEGVE
jgi:DNA-binding Xre family transcriptional regulator